MFENPLQDLSQSWLITNVDQSSFFPEVRSFAATYPGEISLKTTYSEKSRRNTISPAQIPSPQLDQMAWDWISYHCHPLPDLKVEVTQWVPDPRVICGIHRIQNNQTSSRELSITLSCQDEMGLTGIRFRQETHRGRNILTGSSNHRHLALSLSGSQTQASGPTNQLTASVTIGNTETVELRWVLIWSASEEDSRAYLGDVIHLDWNGEVSRRKVSLENQLQIYTGNPAWDLPLAYSQRQARLFFEQLSLQDQENIPGVSSLNAMQTWQLIQALTPLEISQHEWLLSCLLKRDQSLGPDIPIQAELLRQALDAGVDRALCDQILSRTKTHLSDWFSVTHDKDQDGIPENPDNGFFPLDRPRADHGCSVDIWQIEDYQESPAFAALLLNEIHQIEIVQKRITGESSLAESAEREKNLREYILGSWDENEGRFRSRDHLTHIPGKGYCLPVAIKNGWNLIQSELPYPSRLSLFILGASDHRQALDLRVTLQGRDREGRYRIEELDFYHGIWQEKGYLGTTGCVFDQLDYCFVNGKDKDQKLQIRALKADTQDLRLALPLLVEDLSQEIRSALIQRHLSDPASFWSDRGLRTHSADKNSPVQLPLNALILYGLLRSGLGDFGAALLKTWLETISSNLDQTGYLYSIWDVQTGEGLGKGNQLESLLPINSFLKLLGVEFLPSGKLILAQGTPAIFPVKLYFMGVEIDIEEGKTILFHPGKQPQSFSRRESTAIQL